jgi:hypothetical protein
MPMQADTSIYSDRQWLSLRRRAICPMYFEVIAWFVEPDYRTAYRAWALMIVGSLESAPARTRVCPSGSLVCSACPTNGNSATMILSISRSLENHLRTVAAENDDILNYPAPFSVFPTSTTSSSRKARSQSSC